MPQFSRLSLFIFLFLLSHNAFVLEVGQVSIEIFEKTNL